MIYCGELMTHLLIMCIDISVDAIIYSGSINGKGTHHMTHKMLIDLETKCTATHAWEPVATFRFSHMATQAALSFSKLDNGTYRITDNRWPDEGPSVTIITNGKVEA
jgi:hypothetical protein